MSSIRSIILPDANPYLTPKIKQAESNIYSWIWLKDADERYTSFSHKSYPINLNEPILLTMFK
jgi:hypothetical protein